MLQTNNETTISLKGYAKGIYILKITYGDRAEVIEVVKKWSIVNSETHKMKKVFWFSLLFSNLPLVLLAKSTF